MFKTEDEQTFDINQLKESAIADLNEDIEEAQKKIAEEKQYIELIRNLDTTQTVTEKKWHELCETPIRYSDILKIFVQNMWSEADNIKITANSVRFDLYGFTVAIPTSRCMGIEIAPDQTFQYLHKKEPEFIPSNDVKRIMEYFDMRNENVDWYTLYKHKAPYRVVVSSYRKWVCFVLWMTKYKWTKVDEEEWKEKYNDEKSQYEKRVEKYYEHQKELFEICERLFEKLIPALSVFSTNVEIESKRTYGSIEELRKWYQEKKEQKMSA